MEADDPRPRSETKDIITPDRLHRSNAEGTGGYCTHSGLLSKNPKFLQNAANFPWTMKSIFFI